jgi:putative pyoverdin transport system ATP-binding/permease protein
MAFRWQRASIGRKTRMLELIRFLWSQSRKQLLLAAAIGVIPGAAAAVLIAVVNEAIGLGSGQLPGSLWAFALALAAFGIGNYITLRTLTAMSEQIMFNLRVGLARQILRAPLRQLEELGSGRILAVMTSDVLTIGNAGLQVAAVFLNAGIVIFCLAYIGYQSLRLMLLLIAFVVPAALSYAFLGSILQRRYALVRTTEDSLFADARGLTDGAKELKLNATRRRAFLEECFEATAGRLRVLRTAMATVSSGFFTWGRMLIMLALGLLVFLPASVSGIDPHATRQALVVSLYMAIPLDGILAQLAGLGTAVVALRRLNGFGVQDAQGDLASATARVPLEELSLRQVSHSYATDIGEVFTLGPVDLDLHPGELVFVTGGNGSGKTTLVKILMGLYVARAGEVWWNGQKVDDTNRDAYRQNFCAVFSDFYLFESLLGVTGPTLDTRAHELLVKLRLDKKMQIEKGAFSTTALSQGQRKRLALLVEYLEDRSVYVFDEWAADQDPEFKNVFYHELLPELCAKGKCVIAITHDDRYFHLAHRTVRLDYGKIIADSGKALQQRVS